MIYKCDDGTYVVSDDGVWLPGAYATEEAARIACRCDRSALSRAWEAKRRADGTIPDDDVFTADALRALMTAA